MEPKGHRTPVEIINYHFKGACFKTTEGNLDALNESNTLKFYIGNKEIPEKITHRIVWETVEKNGMFGVEFTGLSAFHLERASRFDSHKINVPVLHCKDPLDPNRVIYFKVRNLSKTGLRLSTSLTNKHIFPGMELTDANLTIPGVGETKLNLYIENCKTEKDSMEAEYGVSIHNPSNEFLELAAHYVSNLATIKKNEKRLETLESAQMLSKKLSAHLTIQIIDSPEEYEKVLKLRFLGYRKAKKTSSDMTFRDMGEGLKTEGFVLAAYLAGELVASCEFRMSKFHELVLSKKLDLSAFPQVNTDHLSEINKLVVHPKAKGTDIVLGIFQKIHSIAIINGTPDGIILSEPKLVSLYERLGFHKLNFQMDHPKKKNMKLELMLIKGQAYSDSTGMNPYAWSVAFELSHQFFSNIGVQTQVNFNIKQRLVKSLTKHYLNFSKRRKKVDKTPLKASPKTKSQQHSRDVSDPRWTKQHINATVFLPYILESEVLIGVNKTNEILNHFGFEKSYFKKLSNWVSIDFFDGFLEAFTKLGDPYTLNRNAGYRATSKEILGANYFIMKHFFSPRVAFKAFERYLPKFNKTRVYKVTESGLNHCRITISNLDRSLIPKSHSTRENWIALLDAYVRVLTGKPAKIEVIRSTFDGDSHCEYLVRWKTPFFKNRFFILAAFLVSFFVFREDILRFLDIKMSIETIAIAVSCTIFTLSFTAWVRTKRKYQDILESMHDFEQNADIKYRELQASKHILEKNYQEGRLLDSINRKIQTAEDLSETLQVALESICSNFGFKRAFIMIIDEESQVLRTAAVQGAQDTVTDLWRFQVDVSSRRDNPALLSSVFHTGQSVVINDIANHLFHLNETSRFLIKKLNVTGFSMVPIPSESKSWGVLVADKGDSKEEITRRELVSMKRISQSIGLALDKKSKLDSEITTRKIFQKYVPAWLVDETLKNREPELGGKTKQAICLFLDIRNFTYISSVLPPEVLVEMLNDVYHSLQETVSEHKGVIDKFLGDGALVTWGVYPWSPMDADLALGAVFAFLENLEELNKKLQPKGIPRIEVGVGIHKGPVIAGNIGSSERMEFTVIGSTVNMAARLEQLTKKFDAHIVVSEDVIDFETLSKDWTVHKKIQIRGIVEKQDVACLTHKKGA